MGIIWVVAAILLIVGGFAIAWIGEHGRAAAVARRQAEVRRVQRVALRQLEQQSYRAMQQLLDEARRQS